MHLQDALLGLVRAEVGRVQTTYPGVVVGYNRARQTAAVQVVPRLRWRNPDTDEVVFEQVPQLPDVPVLFPAGAGVSIVWDLAAGDPVWVVLADRCIGEWKDTGNADTEPQVPRRWDFSDAVAIPGGHPPADPLAGGALPSTTQSLVLNADTSLIVRSPDVRLGSASAVGAVALAPGVAANLTTLQAAITSALSAGAASPDPAVAAAFAAAGAALTAALVGWPYDTGATRVKAL